MISWKQIRPALIDVFTKIAPDLDLSADKFEATWREGQRGAIHDKQLCAVMLKVTSVVGIGEDETRRDFVPEDSQDPADQEYLGMLREVQTGQRKFNLQVEVHVPAQTDDFWAFAVTERIRTRIRRPSIIRQLSAVEVAFIRMTEAVKTSYTDSGRVVSAAVLNVTFGTVANDIDTTAGGWIEFVELTGHLQDTSGVELPAPPNWNKHWIPENPPD